MHAGAIALKGGTEAEEQSIEDCMRMYIAAGSLLPLHVKVGGQEPLNDLGALLRLRIRSVLFPMIETPFAVEKAGDSLRKVARGERVFDAYLNLESNMAWRLRDSILDRAVALGFAGINVGRTDLGGSIGARADDCETTEMATSIIAAARDRELRTGVGGGINTRTIVDLLQATRVDTFETRNVVFATARVSDPAAAVRAALLFELELNRLEAVFAEQIAEAHHERIEALRLRRIDGTHGLDGQ